MKTYQIVLLVIGVAVVVFGTGIALVAVAGFWYMTPQGVATVEIDPPPGEAPDPEDGVRIIANASLGDADKGKLGALAVHTKKGKSNIPIAEWHPRLVEEMRQLRRDPAVRDHVRIQADRRVPWASAVAIMDACKEAGFTNVGFSPPPD